MTVVPPMGPPSGASARPASTKNGSTVTPASSVSPPAMASMSRQKKVSLPGSLSGTK